MAVFLHTLGLDFEARVRFVSTFGLIPAHLFGAESPPPLEASIPPILTLLTSMFLHGGWAHLFLNMLVLWSFGRVLEPEIGRWRFAALYFAAGIAGGLAHAILAANSTVPVIGASGAIAGILGAAVVAHPRMRVLLIFIPMPLYVGVLLIGLLHAVLLIGGWGTGIALWAHAGGFLGGLIAYRIIIPRRISTPGPWQ